MVQAGRVVASSGCSQTLACVAAARLKSLHTAFVGRFLGSLVHLVVEKLPSASGGLEVVCKSANLERKGACASSRSLKLQFLLLAQRL